METKRSIRAAFPFQPHPRSAQYERARQKQILINNDPQYAMGLGDFFRSFVEEEARRMGKTLDEVRAWQPPEKPGRRKRGGS